ncbi:MAG: glycosyltransferase [Pseudomonadales bacterium]|nr:glycosyltransferase [Pseudomonadales bacterium]
MTTSKKNIIYITQLLPYPPISGGRIKSLNTIQTLSKKFNIILICFSKNRPSKKSLAYLKKYVKVIKVFHLPKIDEEPKEDIKKLLKNYFRFIPNYVSQFHSNKATTYINNLIQKISPTVIHIDHINMAQYLPKNKKQAWILEEHNVEYQLAWKRFLNFQEIKKTKVYLLIEFVLTYAYERKFLRKFDHIFSISEFDKLALEKKFYLNNISVQAPVYIDNGEKRSLIEKHKKEILFIGDMTWMPNIIAVKWFIDKIFPLILRLEGSTTLIIVGKTENDFKHQYDDHKNIRFLGFQMNISEYFKKASLFVLPFKVGGGVRIKALTAFSHSLAIVTTKLGIQGIKGTNYRDFLIAENEKQFAKACLLLIRNEKINKLIGENGWKYLQKNHSKNNNSEFLKKYNKLIQ